MIRFLDGQVVSHWELRTWKHEGENVVQVHILLWNGMYLIMNWEDFAILSEI